MRQEIVDVQKKLVNQFNRVVELQLEAMKFCDDTASSQGDLSLILADSGGSSVRLKFLGVRNLELRTGKYRSVRLVGLAIYDMSDDQWSGVKLRVASEDDEAYLFLYCEDVLLESDL